MDPTWLASLFGPGAMDTAQFSGGTLGPVQNPTTNTLFPWLSPGVQTPPQPTPSGAPTAPSGAPVPNPPAMPPAIGPAPTETAGLMNQATADPSRILQTLRGVTPPPGPTVQKVETPKAPQTHPIQARSIADMLASLGIGPAALPRLGGLGGRYG